jgi:ATP phosphoribosyltransferase regulatory subunit
MPIDQISRVPPGSQDLVLDAARARRRMQAEWFELAESRGYSEVIPPTFEYEEVFTLGVGPALTSRLIRFLDRDGRLVALRADFTSSIARLAASRLADHPLPLRLCYAGKVYRQEAEGGGRSREIFQMGAELIGDGSAEADVEILRLALDTLRARGVTDFQVNLGDIRFVEPLLAGLADANADRLRVAIDRKDRVALAGAARDIGAPAAVARALVELPELIGRGEVLRRASALASGPEGEAAIERLARIDALLEPEEREHVVYDLGEIRGLGYYTGIQFEIFAAGVGRAVGHGGRYDGLLALYGADRPAIGFAVDMERLGSAGEEL